MQTESGLTSPHTLVPANHLIYAYRIPAPGSNKINQNFDSDGDHGVGLELLKKMQNSNIINCIWFATRTCKPGYQHIGTKRFDHVKNLCEQASKRLT